MNLFKLKQQEPDQEDEGSIEGERALTSVNKGVTLQNKLTNWAVVIGLCVLTGVLLYKYYAGMYKEYEGKKTPVKDVTRTVATTALPPFSMPDPDPPSASPALAADKPPRLQAIPMTQGANIAAGNGQPPVKSLAELVQERRLKSSLRFNLQHGTGGADAGPKSLATTDAADTSGVQAESEPRSTKAMQPAHFSAAHAYMVPDPTLIMTRGKVIPCTLVPAIDTTLAGMVTCLTGEDATGADNKVSLMDRGTVCVGQQGGGVTHGQRRVGIIWQRCETPQHVLVPLESGATDALGRPGLSGQVDNHFWDRFGAAIALSLISDIGPYLTAVRQGGDNNTTIAFPNILNGPQAVMGEVLKNTMDIRPTITAPQGARVLIYLAGDIDFRDVYQLERSKQP
ncbi:TrbI/VirB10 family protein [Herbaspirillum sp. SJZ107]|uniref:TrbI/VirB10 family protein n=1 Tax=Herbaspirillum sp. SJZ107 TaxID=2572881 RepID=UPI001154F290|nr:TrbI/VirB10 family protein [Herbaspirillum sp. SJZ107]TQK07823.1 type IV secretion system protein VirB10 [Herbaspirillum sp. SJZ107]